MDDSNLTPRRSRSSRTLPSNGKRTDADPGALMQCQQQFDFICLTNPFSSCCATYLNSFFFRHPSLYLLLHVSCY